MLCVHYRGEARVVRGAFVGVRKRQGRQARRSRRAKVASATWTSYRVREGVPRRVQKRVWEIATKRVRKRGHAYGPRKGCSYQGTRFCRNG